MVDAQTAAVASGDIHIGSGTTDTAKGSVVKITVPSLAEPATVFFIGGAGDKTSYYFSGPNNNVVRAQEILEARISDLLKRKFYVPCYLGYYEVHSKSDIKKNVLSVIPSKTAPVYIVGHSLGAWNGAHLSRMLTDAGYNVVMLVTLDPVGGGAIVTLGSSIWSHAEPTPNAKVWINVHAAPTHPNQSDGVANFGDRWVIKSGPNVNVDVNVNHANAGAIFNTKLANGMTVPEIMENSIRSWTRRATAEPSK
ncbi:MULTISPECIES: alpha/beta hydrolase [unclassified Dyella]|uniref:alpha/beta hydrolase n=1 Tax=unclassified Dyella TaxID=2634549 RepID=UPI000C8454BC|nr:MULTISPECIES: alpha/beta hydrolase [unclassified Dyella]MDR3445865.1 hypothetical protein [Dyella sp.]PMQ04389.1 hypothetical protein DyAD56_15415 [Dyella sp. AD56]